MHLAYPRPIGANSRKSRSYWRAMAAASKSEARCAPAAASRAAVGLSLTSVAILLPRDRTSPAGTSQPVSPWRIISRGPKSQSVEMTGTWQAHCLDDDIAKPYLVVLIAVRYVLAATVTGPWRQLATALLAGLVAYAAIMRFAMPGWLTTLRRGTMDTVSHGVSRHAPMLR